MIELAFRREHPEGIVGAEVRHRTDCDGAEM
jgi:hypothetical protein